MWQIPDYTSKIAQELLRRGIVYPFMSPQQREFFEGISKSNLNYFGMLACRKMGKTFSAVLDAYGYALRSPNKTIRIVLPTFKNAKDVLFPIFRELSLIFPNDVLPELRRSEATLYFKNGSMICCNGSSRDNIDGARGPKCSRIYLDEAGAYDESVVLELIYSILLPQMSLEPDAKMIATLTPASNPQHVFMVNEIPKLRRLGTMKTYTIDDNVLLSDEKKKEIEVAYGGRQSLEFRREFLAETITKHELKLVPELDRAKHVINMDIADVGLDCSGVRPRMQGIIACDLGVVDLTGIVGLLVDTFNNKAIVMWERTLHGNSLAEFAEVYKELYSTMTPYCTDIISIADCFEQSRITLQKDHELHFNRPMKRGIEDNIGALRNFFARDRILIHESCKFLLTQLEFGMWSESKIVSKDIARSSNPELSHCDHLISLAYALRRVNFSNAPKTLTLGLSNSPSPRRNPFANIKNT